METEFKPKLEAKSWDKNIEHELYSKWEKEDIYSFNRNKNKPIFVIDTPPPYPSGKPWHIGAASHYSQIDMIARTARMKGNSVLFPIGIDRNGLPVEIYTEKKYKLDMKKTSREQFIKLCSGALDELEEEMITIMKNMGMSCDFNNHYRTDSDEYRKITQTTFIDLWKKGLIYESTRPNNYCSDCGTTIADADVNYVDLQTELVYMNFKIKETNDDILVATTRPELLCSCQAVIVNPDDERYNELHGKHVIIPIFNREVEIKPHSSAKPEFGSGAVMICSYGDYTDVRLFRELKLKEIIAINTSNLMTENAKEYSGLEINEARKKIISDLKNKGVIIKSESIKHRTPICERSRTPIEIIPMNEFYLKQLEDIDEVTRISNEITFHPRNHKQILNNWIDSVSIDWPISRRRYYATEIPIWYCANCKEIHIPESKKYYQPWKEKAPFTKCNKCNEDKFVGEDRTLDTWMDSSISPLFISNYVNDKETDLYPVEIRPQGKDIVRTWLYYTLLRCYQLTGESPFKRAWIMGYGVDEKGERMSKSKGNVIDPIPVLEQFGADNFRLWAASESNIGSDFRCSETRIKGTRLFLTKLWNISRYISNFPIPKEAELENSDKWILAEISALIKRCQEGYSEFNFFIIANNVREFTWNIFAANYMELAKKRAYGVNCTPEQQKSAWYTLHICLKTILLLIAPIIPFITDHIWRNLYGEEGIHKRMFPEDKWETKDCIDTKRILEFNSNVWNLKKEKGISFREPISLEIPNELEKYSNDIKSMHNINEKP